MIGKAVSVTCSNSIPSQGVPQSMAIKRFDNLLRQCFGFYLVLQEPSVSWRGERSSLRLSIALGCSWHAPSRHSYASSLQRRNISSRIRLRIASVKPPSSSPMLLRFVSNSSLRYTTSPWPRTTIFFHFVCMWYSNPL